MSATSQSKAATKPVKKLAKKPSTNRLQTKLGRPPLPPELRRSGRISMRTYPEIADKVARNGTEWMERLISRAKDADEDLSSGAKNG